MNDNATELEFERRLRAWYHHETETVLPAPAELREEVAAIPRSSIRPAGRMSGRRTMMLFAAALIATSIGGVIVVGGSRTRAPSPTPPPPVTPPLPAQVVSGLAWRSVAPMSVGRVGHTATLLADGRVLVTGGYSASAEIWDPATRTFAATGSMGHLRTNHAAALLSDGRVLVVGGNTGGQTTGDYTREVEAWSPATGTFSVVGSLPVRRGSELSATVLRDGRVLIAGGVDCPSNPAAPPSDDPCAGIDLRATVMFDPATDTLTPGPRLGDDRVAPTAVALLDGRVFFIGITGYRQPAIAEVLDPVSGRVETIGNTTARPSGMRATLLDDGRVLIMALSYEPAGRLATVAEIWDPSTGRITRVGESASGRYGSAMARLEDGTVLVAAGGAATSNDLLTSTEVWDVRSNAAAPGPSMAQARVDFTLTVLADGTVLALGGTDKPTEDPPLPLDTAELMAPSEPN